jgi:hypothetical protein
MSGLVRVHRRPQSRYLCPIIVLIYLLTHHKNVRKLTVVKAYKRYDRSANIIGKEFAMANSTKGFASMSPARRKEIAKKGGEKSHGGGRPKTK